MKAADRTRLTGDLGAHVAAIADDLREQMRSPGSARERAKQLHADEQVGEDFEVWTDLLARRAAVLWVLKSVYVRVLEDRGLLNPGRILDLEAQQLFERLAPNLGETAFLRWVYRDLASPAGGLPELFGTQPAEVAEPADELSRRLIAFWRHRDPDTGAGWSFAEEHFEGELMGDLYQELDPVVKDRFALCQTPEFVRGFILDRTLTPAIETFGADVVRLLDPACGSGHFLIDGLKRLVAATAAQHPDWSRPALVAHCLERVVGMDLNDYACALARARLVMTAAELAGVRTLADAAPFHPQVYWADGLEQVERDEVRPRLQYGLFETSEETPRALLTRADVRAALQQRFGEKFHAVVANPPYIFERDPARRAYHREKVGRRRRYVTAYREYSLGGPFTERCFQLAEKDGFVGVITGNGFLKREFGKPVIEQVLVGVDLTLVVDTSQAYIPHHGTPTVLLFARNRMPNGDTVRVVLSRRGESGTPEDPAHGQVWQSIVAGWSQSGFENEYVSVADLPRATLARHPWSLGGGGAAELKELIEQRAASRLKDYAEVGTGAVTREDDVFVIGRAAARRLGIPDDQIRAFVEGDVVRDWGMTDPSDAIWPYDPDSLGPLSESQAEKVSAVLWPWRRRLERRIAYGKTQIERGLRWFEYSMFFADRFRTPLSIAFAFVTSHNHFVLDRGGKVFNRSAPVIKLPPEATEADHLALLGVLNSSTACFWMKQVFHNKGGGTDTGKMQSDPAKVAHEFTATGIAKLPCPDLEPIRERFVRIAERLDFQARERSAALFQVLPGIQELPLQGVDELRDAIRFAGRREEAILQSQIVLQEELDWLVYLSFGLVDEERSHALLLPDGKIDQLGVPVGARPFELLQARSGRAEGVDGQQLLLGLPDDSDEELRIVWDSRMNAIRSVPALELIEREHYKRRWCITPKHLAGRVETFADRTEARLAELQADLLESVASKRSGAFDVGRIVADLQGDARFTMITELIEERRDFDPESIVRAVLADHCVPSHRFHRYSSSGLVKHGAWQRTWEAQRREDAGDKVVPPLPPSFAQGDFLSRRIFELRGKLDVPRERFIAFTEVPGREGAETLYGWAGWTPLQRLRAILAIDEELEDAGTPLADRIALLDSAWRLLPDVAREDPGAAARLKAELQAVVGSDGPRPDLLAAWQERFPPPGSRAGRGKKAAAAGPRRRSGAKRNAVADEPDGGQGATE